MGTWASSSSSLMDLKTLRCASSSSWGPGKSFLDGKIWHVLGSVGRTYVYLGTGYNVASSLGRRRLERDRAGCGRVPRRQRSRLVLLLKSALESSVWLQQGASFGRHRNGRAEGCWGLLALSRQEKRQLRWDLRYTLEVALGLIDGWNL